MDVTQFRAEAHKLVDWMADYFEHIREYPVKSQSQPGDTIRRLPPDPPEAAESFDHIFADFEKIILPGITHWQHPSFFAYFPANSSAPSVLGEMLTSTLAAQCMSWQTSPAATELEERVMQWLGRMIGLSDSFHGVIEGTASTATLCSLLTAREKRSEYAVNARGLAGGPRYTVYCSTETHSSIEKAVKIAGLGNEHLRKINVDDTYAMIPSELDAAIARDKTDGFVPLCVIAALGTTGSTAIDPIRAIGEICRRHDVWLHVDAAFSGTALLLPEMRWMSDGVELADTFVFNPHKWLLTNFDCSAYFVKDTEALVRTFEILPEYLKTAEGDRVNNYRDWGLQLGRRFRALKLWFVIRSFGVDGLRQRVRHHIDLTKWLVTQIESDGDFELLAPAPVSLVCFRFHPRGTDDPATLDRLNERLLEAVNATGKMYISHTRLSGKYTLRMVTAQTNVIRDDVAAAWRLLKTTAAALT